MEQKTIDLRGRPCPEPLMETRKALADPTVQTVAVLVDDRAAAENLTRMAASLGCATSVERTAGGNFRVVATKKAGSENLLQFESSGGPRSMGSPPRAVVFVPSAGFGEGDQELGRILMRSFIKTLKQLQPLPECLIFINSGVRLTTEGSELLNDLEQLAEQGVRILSCGTCLDYHHLKQKLQVGSVSNMYEIVTTLASADRVIRP